MPGRDAVVMLGHDFWAAGVRRRSRRSSAARCGSTASSSPSSASRPPGFTGLDQYVRFAVLRAADDVAAPHPRSEGRGRSKRATSGGLTVKGRLKPGVTMAQAQTELTVIATDLERAYPDTNRNQQHHRPDRAAEPDRAVSAGRDAARDARPARRRRAVRRLRQRRGTAGQPRAGAGARDGAAPGDRRRTSARRPAADHREPADCGRRRRARSRRRLRRRDAVQADSDPDGSADRRRPSSWIGARCCSAWSWRWSAPCCSGWRRRCSATPHRLDRGDEGHRRGRLRPAPAVGPRACWSAARWPSRWCCWWWRRSSIEAFSSSSASGPGFRTDHLLMMSVAPKPAALQRGAGAAVLRAGWPSAARLDARRQVGRR